jgi:hypothetical protein
LEFCASYLNKNDEYLVIVSGMQIKFIWTIYIATFFLPHWKSESESSEWGITFIAFCITLTKNWRKIFSLIRNLKEEFVAKSYMEQVSSYIRRYANV